MAPGVGQRTSIYGDAPVNQDRRVRNVANFISDPEFGGSKDAALYMLLANGGKKGKIIGRGKRTTDNMKYEQVEHNMLKRKMKIDNFDGGLVTGTSIGFAVADAAHLRVGNILHNLKTDERYFITALNYATGVATVTRDLGGFLGGAAAATLATDNVKVIGSAHEEGGRSIDDLITTTEIGYNYCQFFRTSLQMSDIAQRHKLYGEPNDWNWHMKRIMLQHKCEINSSLLFGVRDLEQDAVSGKPIYFTGGVFQHIKGNIVDLSSGSGICTFKTFEAAAEQWFENGSDTKVMLGGFRLDSIIQGIGRNFLNVDSKEVSLGTKMYEVKCGTKGTLLAVIDRKSFDGDPTDTTGTYANRAAVIDPDYLQYVSFEGLDTQVHQHIEENDRAGRKDEIRTYCGLSMWGYTIDHTYNAPTGVPEQFRGVHGELKGYQDS